MSRESKPDQLLEHNYDGIQEYDNPLPGWWVYLFYATILFAVLYFVNVIPGVGSGPGRISSYERDMAAFHRKFPAGGGSGPGEAVILAAAKDPAQLAAGKATFVEKCAPCHRPDAGGLIGPNLTDEYWIHGGKPEQVWKTVNDGVPEVGMPTWSQQLPPEQVLKVVAYVPTLRGTHPINPRFPQGVSEITGKPAPSAP
jgi:cytochrome c oxidase cbb3-type subunit III